MFLDQHFKSSPPPAASEGTSFAQKGQKGKKKRGGAADPEKNRMGMRNQGILIKR